MTAEQTIKRMTFEEWEKEFQPIENHISDNAGLGGLLFETYGDEVLFAVGVANKEAEAGDDDKPTLHVWTYIDAEDETVIVDGWRYVNRIGYLITKKAPDPEHFYEVEM
jgi:hypothetical protein